MRTRITIVFVLLCVALVTCAIVARRSKKSISNDVAFLMVALIPPVVGNTLIIVSGDWLLSTIGCYLYYIGMDIIVVGLLQFTMNYCGIDSRQKAARVARSVIAVLVLVDIFQLMLNPITGMAFTTQEIFVDGAPYYQLIPLAGQVFHRIVAYGIFLTSLVIFIVKCVRSPRIYLERYLVIVLAMLVGGLWQSFYIFSGTPVDRSMIGFGIFGLLVFYFALYHKPFRLLDRMLVRVVSELNDAVFFFDTSGECIYANAKGRRALQIGPDEDIPEIASERVHDFIGGWHQGLDADWTDMRKMERDGEERFFDVRVSQVHDNRGRQVGTSLTVRDATEEERQLQREKYLATHDTLTGLFNQQYLYQRITQLLKENPGVNYKAVAIDVKDFKLLNDIFNKEFGDEVLRTLAQGMRDLSVPGEVYGRLSADKFGFVIPADKFSEERFETVLRDYMLEQNEANYPIVVHAGVYEVTERDLLPSVMFDRAFMAIASIKQDYNRHVAVYDKEMRADLIWSQTISSQMENAMTTGQIRPYLQPMVNAKGGVEGAEVLVRWIHPDEGYLSPARFIPVFEENGMIAQLDRYMWKCACQILAEWRERGIDLFLSVNISPKDFYFIDVYATIRELVDRYKIDPQKLRLEITETVMMSDLENRLKIIEDLRDYGFLVEMDDFGSGYSSLNMLKDIPVDVLKIDMMFLYKTKDQNKAHTILKTIINLSGQLGIPSVTEGVETAEQLAMLTDMGCHLFQGYFFAKPMPRAEFEEIYCRAA